jgi:hypothetical protein
MLAVIWDRAGKPTALEPLPGDKDSFAGAINERGEVAGVSISHSGVETAVI